MIIHGAKYSCTHNGSSLTHRLVSGTGNICSDTALTKCQIYAINTPDSHLCFCVCKHAKTIWQQSCNLFTEIYSVIIQLMCIYFRKLCVMCFSLLLAGIHFVLKVQCSVFPAFVFVMDFQFIL